MKKTCTKCGLSKDLEEFNRSSKTKDKHASNCKSCVRAYVMTTYHTPEGFFRIKYYQMRARCKGYKGHRNNTKGKELLSESEFQEWCQNNQESFLPLFEAWEDGGHTTALVPSIDRINNSVGYVPNNMQWLPFGANMVKGRK